VPAVGRALVGKVEESAFACNGFLGKYLQMLANDKYQVILATPLQGNAKGIFISNISLIASPLLEDV
jgi:hypothetical protein